VTKYVATPIKAVTGLVDKVPPTKKEWEADPADVQKANESFKPTPKPAPKKAARKPARKR